MVCLIVRSDGKTAGGPVIQWALIAIGNNTVAAGPPPPLSIVIVAGLCNHVVAMAVAV